MQYEVVNFEDSAMDVQTVTRQVNTVQQIMRNIMQENEHYGVIPGTKKPSLYKPGAEKLGLVFRLRPEYQIDRSDLPNGHREYEVVCTLIHIPTGQSVGQGVGNATTMEGKYRFRGGEKEGTGRPVPKEYWNLRNDGKLDEAKNLIGGNGFAPGKIDGKWEICSIGEKQEHDNPADYYNTVMKMAKKRAHVDAILTATAASDIFTQDVEDMPETIPGAAKDARPPIQTPQTKTPPKQEPSGNDTGTITPNQTKAIHALLTGLDVTDDLQRHQVVTDALDLPDTLTSFGVLTKAQASEVIKKLGELADEKRATGK